MNQKPEFLRMILRTIAKDFIKRERIKEMLKLCEINQVTPEWLFHKEKE